jgi:hypothetical protein
MNCFATTAIDEYDSIRNWRERQFQSSVPAWRKFTGLQAAAQSNQSIQSENSHNLGLDRMDATLRSAWTLASGNNPFESRFYVSLGASRILRK